jgi:ABC-type multidrug transport system fused ATPase/permease subunit
MTQYPKKRLREQWQSVSGLLWGLVGPRWARMVAGLLIMMIGRAAGLILPASTKYLIDTVILKQNWDRLLPLMLLLFAATIIQTLCSLSVTMIVSAEGHRLVAQLRRRVQAHVCRLPLNFFDSSKAGALCSRILGDVEGTRHLMGQTLMEFLGGILTALFSLAYLLRVNVLLTATAFLALLVFSVVSNKTFKRVRRVFREGYVIQSEVTSRLIESLAGIRVVKSYQAEANEVRVFSKGVDKMLVIALRTMKAGAVMGAGAALVIGIVSSCIMYLAAWQISLGKLTLGGFMTFTAFISFLMAPIFGLQAMGMQLTETLAGLERTEELLHETVEEDNPRRTQVIGPIRGSVVFDHVNFAYNTGKPVLHDITFEAQRGKVTALVGPSGSGKSTIIGLISAFYDATEGNVFVDGLDLSTIQLNSFRSQIGMVLQDTFLFDGTVRENVTFARPDASEQQIRQACQIAHVHEFTEVLPDGYDTIVGERGVKLSGGQRQRISIARAILADPRILILDEATSNLDSESEAAIQEGLKYLMEGRTTFVIAHRLSTIHRADQILVLESGRIVERGTHESLFAAGGRYRSLYSRQQLGNIVIVTTKNT